MIFLWSCCFVWWVLLVYRRFTGTQRQKLIAIATLVPVTLMLGWSALPVTYGPVEMLDTLRDVLVTGSGSAVFAFLMNLGLWFFWAQAFLHLMELRHAIRSLPDSVFEANKVPV